MRKYREVQEHARRLRTPSQDEDVSSNVVDDDKDAAMRVLGCPNPLTPYDNGSKSWYCDDKQSSCDRRRNSDASGKYLGTRWSDRERGGRYDMCDACVRQAGVSIEGKKRTSINFADARSKLIRLLGRSAPKPITERFLLPLLKELDTLIVTSGKKLKEITIREMIVSKFEHLRSTCQKDKQSDGPNTQWTSTVAGMYQKVLLRFTNVESLLRHFPGLSNLRKLQLTRKPHLPADPPPV